MRLTGLFILTTLWFASDLAAQEPRAAGRNNPFTPSPVIEPLSAETTAAVAIRTSIVTATEAANSRSSPNPSVSGKGAVYRVGPGDVLKIDNTVSGEAFYVTVAADGNLIPNAAGRVNFGGRSQEEVEAELKSRIGSDAIKVTIREYASHFVLVKKNGEPSLKFTLRREAVPLFILRSEAGWGPQYRYAILSRASGQEIRLDLSNFSADEMLLFSGDTLDLREDH
jgi:hypothetical protein